VEPLITLTDSPNELFLDRLTSLLKQFNEAAAGLPYDGRRLAILVTHPESQETLGGLWGSTSYSYLHVDAVFVPESLRGLGLGRRLMLKAENEAVNRRCSGSWLDTFSFQARGFYEKLGYRVFGELCHNPPGHTRVFLKKSLSSSAQSPNR